MTGRPAAELTGLADFNVLDGAAARQALLACCSSDRWAAAVQFGRPYPAADALLRRSDQAVAALTPDDLRAALAGHPRIGERAAGPGHGAGAAGGAAGWSRQEQAGLAGAADATRRALAAGNEAYERRFGHIYLVCATGKSAAELLELLQNRLTHDSETEWQVLRSELKKINRLRLLALIGAAA